MTNKSEITGQYKGSASSVRAIAQLLDRLSKEAREDQAKRIIGSEGKLTYPSGYQHVVTIPGQGNYVSQYWPSGKGENDKTAFEASLEGLLWRLNAAYTSAFPSASKTTPDLPPVPDLFASLCLILGFYNFTPDLEDNHVLGQERKQTCPELYNRLQKQLTLSESEWRTLRTAVEERVYQRLLAASCTQYQGRVAFSLSKSLRQSSESVYWYNPLPTTILQAQEVASVVAGKEERILRDFGSSLSETLRVLPHMAQLRGEKEPPVPMAAFLHLVDQALTAPSGGDALLMRSRIVPLAGIKQLVFHSPRAKKPLLASLCEDGTIREAGSLYKSNAVLGVEFTGCVTRSRAAQRGEEYFYLENAVADVAAALQKNHPEQYRLPHLRLLLAVDEDSLTSAETERRPAPVTLTLPLGAGNGQDGRKPAVTLTVDIQAIASLKDFVAFFADLQSQIAAEKKKVGNTAQYPQKYRLTKSFQSGVYGSGVFRDYPREWDTSTCDPKNALEMSLKLLTKLVQGTMQQRTPLTEGQCVLTDQEFLDLFMYASSYRGFYNFLPLQGADNKTFGSELANFCVITCMHLALVQSIAEPDWKRLAQAALYRVHERLLFAWANAFTYTGGREDTAVRLLRDQSPYKDYQEYHFPHPFAYEHIDALGQQVIAEEEKRLRSFVTMLHGTLAVLSQAALTAAAIKESDSQEVDILKTLQSLQETLLGSGKDSFLRQPFSPEESLLLAKPLGWDNASPSPVPKYLSRNA